MVKLGLSVPPPEEKGVKRVCRRKNNTLLSNMIEELSTPVERLSHLEEGLLPKY